MLRKDVRGHLYELHGKILSKQLKWISEQFFAKNVDVVYFRIKHLQYFEAITLLNTRGGGITHLAIKKN